MHHRFKRAATALLALAIPSTAALATRDATASSPAARELELRCDAGHMPACTDLAKLLFAADGVDQDEARANALLLRACAHSHAAGCAQLGLSYAMGRGVAQDAAVAKLYHRQACLGGSPLGCVNLSMHYPDRIGPREDVEVILGVYEVGCTEGNFFACRRAARIHELGWSTRSSIARADALRYRICAVFDRSSCNDLAWSRCHDRGICTQEEEDLAERSLPADIDGAHWDTYAFVLCQRGKSDAARDAYAEACERSDERCGVTCPDKATDHNP
ncbi:MAG: tetratricopeptide repeat protein [Myxococcota bacterium]